jgi:biopolymer transport protein ExbB
VELIFRRLKVNRQNSLIGLGFLLRYERITAFVAHQIHSHFPPLFSETAAPATTLPFELNHAPQYKGHMLTLPEILSNGGVMFWLILLVSAVALVVFMERFLHYHRAQINSTEFLNGVRNVLRRDNVVEAISICDATPGPVARLVKTAILNRDHDRERISEALEEAGLAEVPRLEEKLNLLATIAQIAPLLGLLGTVIGLMHTFSDIQGAGLMANPALLSKGVWKALICSGAGLAVAIPAHAGYNYLVSRVNSIVLDMERAATEIVHIAIGSNNGNLPTPAP